MILTNQGIAALAAVAGGGSVVGLTHVAVGDGGGAQVAPAASQTGLVNEVWRGAVAAVHMDADNPAQVVVEAVIPVDAGGFVVREVGVFDSSGALFAVGSVPDTTKTTNAHGAVQELALKCVLAVGNCAAISMALTPDTTLVNRAYVEQKLTEFIPWSAESHLHAESGWQRLPGGLLLQWGRIAPFMTTGDTHVDVVFPVEFEVAPFFANWSIGAQALTSVIGPLCRQRFDNWNETVGR